MTHTDQAILVALISLLSGLVVALIASARVARTAEGTDAQRTEPFVGFLGGCLLSALVMIFWRLYL